MARRLNREQSLILEEKIVSLRYKGYSYRRIASELNTSLDTIHRMLKKTSTELQRRIDDAKIVIRWEEYLISTGPIPRGLPRLPVLVLRGAGKAVGFLRRLCPVYSVLE
jgi:hypothetical protein